MAACPRAPWLPWPTAHTPCARPALFGIGRGETPRSTLGRSTRTFRSVISRAGAELLGRALHGPRRARHPRRRTLHQQEDRRRRRVPHQGAPLRHRDRVFAVQFRRSPASTAFPISPTRRSSTTRRGCTPHHHRRRLVRARAGAGLQPARLARHGAGARQGAGRRGSRARARGARGAGVGGHRRPRGRQGRSASRAVSAACASTSASAARGTSSKAAIFCCAAGTQAGDQRPRPRGGGHPLRRPAASRSNAASRRPTAASSPSATSPERRRYAQLADYHADIVIRRALFHAPARVDARIIPRVTFTDPELAHVGLIGGRGGEARRQDQRPALALPRERPGPGGAGDRRPRQGR